MKLIILPKATEDHGNVVTVNLVYDGNIEELQKIGTTEKARREKLGIDIKQIESIAEQTGITNDNDDPEDVESEFYDMDGRTTNQSKANELDASAFSTSANEIIDTEKEEIESDGKKEEDDIGKILG
jgi:predicted nucleotidyltransferase